MNILVLSGGNSPEREVSIRSGKAVSDEIDRLGHKLIEADPASDNFKLEEFLQNIDLVFIALHGEGGEDGTIQVQLEQANVPFVGSGSKASELCFDKWKYKQLLNENDLPASKGWLVSKQNLDEAFFQLPYVLKPLKGGSSLDTLIERTPRTTTINSAEKLLSQYEHMLLEPLVEGVEITVGILDENPLPVIEIIPPEGLEFDYENKYNGATKELCPPQNVSLDLQKKSQELALKVHKLTGCKDMSRTDIMIDAQGALHILETNTIPGLTSQSLYPKMIQSSGLSMTEGIEKLISLAIS